MEGGTDIITWVTLSMIMGLTTHLALAQCNTPLGFENGNIKNDQLTATPWMSEYGPNTARLNNRRGWVAKNRDTNSLSSEYYKSDRRLTVDLLTQHQVTRYSIQGSRRVWNTNFNPYSKTVALYYSQEAVVWKRYVRSDGIDLLEGNTDPNTVRTFDLDPPVQARYFSFIPTEWNGRPSLRLELYGCEANKSVTSNFTVVTQNIEDTQHWLLSKSPYVVNSMINIQATGYVQVEAGVRIIFSSRGGLNVSGTLEGNGLNGLPVVFTSKIQGFLMPERWNGIHVYDKGNITLQHCDVREAFHGISGPLSSITIRHSHVRCNKRGVQLSWGDTDPRRTQFVGTRITKNTEFGIYCNYWGDDRRFMALKNCEFSRNGVSGLFSPGGDIAVAVENSLFSETLNGIYTQDSSIEFTMKNCTILQNKWGFDYLSFDKYAKWFNVTVDASRFTDNTYGIRFKIKKQQKKLKLSITNSYVSSKNWSVLFDGEYLKETSIILENNTIGSTGADNYSVSMIGYGIENNKDVTIKNNLFNTLFAIALQGGSVISYFLVNNTFTGLAGNTGIRIDGGNITILNNRFSYCTSFSVIYTKVVHTFISGNIFLNPNARYDVTIDVPYTEGNRLNASHNYWGSSDRFYVRSRIYDFFYDMNRVIADVHPFYTTKSLTELSNERDPGYFSFQRADTIGGILTDSLILDPHQHLFVSRSLYIPEGIKLTILENVTLVFPYYQGILVQGVLDIQGVHEGKVVLTNEGTDNIRWRGVILNSTGSTMKHMVLMKSQTGLNLTTNNTGTVVVTDSNITQCDTAISGQLWDNASLSLHRVKLIAFKAIKIKKMGTNKLFLDFLQSHIIGQTYLHSDVKGGRFTVRIESSTFSEVFEIESCRTNTSMIAYNSTFSSTTNYTLYIKSGPQNILIRDVSVSGHAFFKSCSFSLQPGMIDIQNSRFTNKGGIHALALGTWDKYDQNSPHKVLLVNNTFHTLDHNDSLDFDVSDYSSSWSIIGKRNTFTSGGIYLDGSVSNASFDGNIFIGRKTVLLTNIKCNESSTITFTGNVVHGGPLTLYSQRASDEFILQENLFNGSTVIVKNPNTYVHRNTFLRGSRYDIQFTARGYSNKEINCSFNYWDTNDRRAIDLRLYDSADDESLPTIIYTPFFQYQYNCSETLYGPKCLPYINVLNIIPNAGPDIRGIKVHIWGHNFPETDMNIFYCRFNRTVVNGTRVSKEHIVCNAPPHPNGEVIVEVSPDHHQFTRNQTKFTFYEACQLGACGMNMTPPHGHCLYGGCVCTLPWSGGDCNIELKAPIISIDSENQLVDEGVEYQLQSTLTQGSVPIDWFLYGAPSGMSINPRTGLIYWERTVARVDPYRITVKASNRIGHSEVILSLTIPLSYNVTIDDLTPSDLFHVPKSVQIKGHVQFFSGTNPPLVVSVDVIIRNKGNIARVISLSTSPTAHGTFKAVYIPNIGDSGLFEVDGRHPSDSGFTEQRSWRVLGMKCVPGYTSRQAYLDTEVVEMRGVTLLRNAGVDTIRNITVSVQGAGGPLRSVVVRINNVLSSDETRPLIETLEPDTELTVDLILTASRPLRGTIGVVFSTAEGTQARVRVGLRFNVKRPVLVTSPETVTERVPRGTQKIVQLYVTNEGDVQANGLKVSLPAESRLSISAFSTSKHQVSDVGLDLQPNETAILVLSVTARSTDALGEFSGLITLNSNLASTSVSYKFYVTSLEKLNVTIRVEDEFTYFASDKPLVSGAVVTLKNQMRGYIEQRVTSKTGIVVFEDVPEDRYTLQATAPGHSSYSAVIITKPSDSSFSIFLQRVAVTYTWTVTPTTFEDKYIVTLDSTFETHVPMPVVTIEPANIDITPYEEGMKHVINFTITNHGLIRADNVRFLVPQNHPTLTFTQPLGPIGAVDANTSIIVPVSVRVKTRVKRSQSVITSCLKMLYDYICGQTRTGGQDITMSRQSGRPPLPCQGVLGGNTGLSYFVGGGEGEGGGGGGGGGGYFRRWGVDFGGVGIGRWTGQTANGGVSFANGGGGSGSEYFGISDISGTSLGWSRPSSSVVEYNPVTPLSCSLNCGGTIIKDCVLGFNPISGCALAIDGLSGNTGFFDNLKAGLDFGFACIMTPLTPVCPVCGAAATLWQLGSCVGGIYNDCISKGRSRRAATSEVIQGLVDSNVAMQNYLVMMKDIYGGEDMFDVHDNSWMNPFNLALAEDSVGDRFLSHSEITSIVAPLNTSLVPTVQKFLYRWNRTMTAWEDGTLNSLGPQDDVMSFNTIMTRSEQFKKDTDTAKQRGFNSIFDEFDDAVKVYKEKEKKGESDEGVCAKVRVSIIQELVLTRDAFNARLEIENGEQSALENIAVTISFRATYGDGTYTNDRFSVGNPTLVGLTAVDGSGRLERDVSGSAEWLIIPYSTAAVKEDTLYDVGGNLSYSVDGSVITVTLLPDIITVKPNPSLILNYFHEKYVQGDDTMTANITEPVVPFTLAVMVTNGAYGVARQLKKTSAHPEFIENEKGLLTSFKVIGAQLGNQSVTPSFSINFGDIESFETKVVRWSLTSSLKGKFYNYTATFENINPLGDPQLSIMEHVGYHQLIHLVRLESTEDELDDFLVNDVIDGNDLPDAVYDSSNGSSSTVVQTTVDEFSLLKSELVGKRTYTYAKLVVTVSSNATSTYIYTRLVNNLTRDSISERLLEVMRADDKQILVGNNAWQTNYYHDSFYLHVFDFVSNLNYSKSVSYYLTFGPRKMSNDTNTTTTLSPIGGPASNETTTPSNSAKDISGSATASLITSILVGLSGLAVIMMVA